MDLLIGATAKIGDSTGDPGAPANFLEARVLSVRSARRRERETANEQRKKPGRPRDPVNGRVLVLLVPTGEKLPEGLDRGEYRVFLRFTKR